MLVGGDAAAAAEAARIGLAPLPAMTLMTSEPEGPIAVPPGWRVRRATTPAERAAASSIHAAAFRLPPAADAAALAASPSGPGAVEVFLAEAAGRPVSVASVVRAGAVAGIWGVGTLPGEQRRGAASALLAAVMERCRAEGVARFYLFAGAAGRPVYARLGFDALAPVPLYEIAAP
jgi:GNAT superfamily N-acetyltransferase